MELLNQVVRDVRELKTYPEELLYPIADQKHQDKFLELKTILMPGLIHCYPDRMLFLPRLLCLMYCRFFFRKNKVYNSTKRLNPDQIANIFQYIQRNPAIVEVILSGGDPFFFVAMLKLK